MAATIEHLKPIQDNCKNYVSRGYELFLGSELIFNLLFTHPFCVFYNNLFYLVLSCFILFSEAEKPVVPRVYRPYV